MKFIPVIICFITTVTLSVKVDHKSARYVKDADFDDRVSFSGILSTSDSDVICSLSCLETEGCASFFFNKDSEECKLMGSILLDQLGTVSSSGTRYFKIKQGKLYFRIHIYLIVYTA